MDPNEVLKRVRAAVAASRRATVQEIPGHNYDLCQAFDDLDAWLVRGGFLPRDWQHKKGNA